MMKKMLVLGYFGYQDNQIDGQTIKTRNTFKLLKDNNLNVDFFDTQIFKSNRFTLFLLLKKIIWADKIIYLPAHNNLKFIFPVLFLICSLFGKQIFYFVIGGWLFEFLLNKPIHRFLLKKITAIFVETVLLKDNLISAGFRNVEIIPNFKFYKAEVQPPIVDNEKLVFISRINKKKGLDVLFKLVDDLADFENLKIDFYGPICETDREYFFKEIEKRSATSYKGVVDSNLVVETISNYSFMVFPTQYYTEGMPGIIIDAYFADLPLVATNWQYAREFIDDGRTGLISKWGDQDDFIEKVRVLLNNPSKLKDFRIKISQKKHLYTEKYAWEMINKFVINDFSRKN